MTQDHLPITLRHCLSSMKPIIFPLIALIAAGAWHYVNASKIADLKVSLETEASTNPVPAEEILDEEKSFMAQGDGIELERFESFLGKVSKGEVKSNGNNAWLWIQQQFNLMSGDDLLAFLEELEHSDFPQQEREKMVAAINKSLIYRHPETYLRHFGIKTGYGYLPSWNAFFQFMEKDKAGAISWFDDYLKNNDLGEAEISVDHSTRLKFEKMIAYEIYPHDLDAVEKRIKNLNQEQAYAVIRALSSRGFPEVSKHFLNLARTHLPEEQAAALIGNTFTNTTRGKELTEVAKIINDHQLTNSEKNAFYKRMATDFAWNSDGDFEKTTSRICQCCSLKGRLKRITDENLKSKISATYQRNLDQSKK